MAKAADMHWGVDTINKPSVLFRHLKGMNASPSFVGRYLNESPPGDLDRAEVDFYLARDIRILLIYICNSGLVGEKKGADQAAAAIAKAKSLRVPEDCDITIFADVEPNVHVDEDWIMGWWKAMFNSKYGGRGGLYVNFDKRNAQHQKTVVANAVARFPKSDDAPIRIYSQSPFKGEVRPGDAKFDFEYKPDELDLFPGSSVVWQYQTNCVIRGSVAMCDFDLANDDGFDCMWAASDENP
jgi:hypothetical protein